MAFSFLEYYWYYLVSFVMNISGAKFEEHCSYISRNILYSVFSHFPNLLNKFGGNKPRICSSIAFCRSYTLKRMLDFLYQITGHHFMCF